MQSKKTIIFVLSFVLATFLSIYLLYDFKNKIVKTIIEEADIYKNQKGNFGLIPNFNLDNYSCFSGDTFIRTQKIQDTLAHVSVANVSCKFKVDKSTGVVEKWSVSLQVGEEVYCGDSQGENMETPGFTLTESCKGE